MDTDGKGPNAPPIAYLVCRLSIYRQIVDAKAFRTDLRDGAPNRHLTRSVFTKACTLTRSPTLIVSRVQPWESKALGLPSNAYFMVFPPLSFATTVAKRARV